MFRVATKSAPELAVMKTVVEGGATVQVTAANGSDSEEEDDENVYNVKVNIIFKVFIVFLKPTYNVVQFKIKKSEIDFKKVKKLNFEPISGIFFYYFD